MNTSEATPQQRHSTGIDALDRRLGGGLLPGTLTVVVGATGIGKTQLGVQAAAAGQSQEGRRGIFLDLSARGDSQCHVEYAERIAGWTPAAAEPLRAPYGEVFDSTASLGERMAVFGYAGRRVTRNDLDFEQWRHWQSTLNSTLQSAIAYLYGNLVRGVERVVVDGIEPSDRPADSVQLQLFEYVYHQVLRKDSQWVARDLFRENYRANAERAARHAYDFSRLSCLLLCTSQEAMLDDLITRPLEEGGLLALANTVILMGKTRDGARMGRALFIAKHRGSACSDEIHAFRIEEQGLELL